jgi:hypothetical protein
MDFQLLAYLHSTSASHHASDFCAEAVPKKKKRELEAKDLKNLLTAERRLDKTLARYPASPCKFFTTTALMRNPSSRSRRRRPHNSSLFFFSWDSEGRGASLALLSAKRRKRLAGWDLASLAENFPQRH